MLILAPMMTFVRKHKLGYVTGEAGGYEVDGERYAPDVAFISTKPVQTGYNPTPPELAVEVLSPSDSPSDLAKKIEHYLRAGTVVWAVYPEESKVRVHVPGKPVQLLGMEDVLDASPIIPGFRLPVREIFPED
jgi:Uma2 family endonuclease